MPSLAHRQKRRQQFLQQIDGPVLLMAGGQRSRNYPDNPYPFRADGSFLYFFAAPEPGSAALFDPADGTVTMFLDEDSRTPAGALWYGPVPGFEDMRQHHGVDRALPLSKLEQHVRQQAGGRTVHGLAVADEKATARAAALTGEPLDFYHADRVGHPDVIDALARLRRIKDEEELQAMRRMAAVTDEAHVEAMRATAPGVSEQQLCGVVDGCFWRHGCVPAYNTILSVRGEVLHNHDHGNTCQTGDILLLDAGAEDPDTGYCADVTRCWPVHAPMSSEAAAVYDTVLRAELAAIEMVRPGVRYRDLHMASARVIAEGLVDLGVLRGRTDALVEAGAHALFFPHGVGHLLGIDVHDMEAFGDRVACAPGRARSPQFGTKYLRLDLDLEPGMTFTIEPGIYFVPAILHADEFRQPFADMVDFGRAEAFLRMNHGRGFGGIRIEDDVVCTADGAEVLTAAIPKRRVEVEALVGQG